MNRSEAQVVLNQMAEVVDQQHRLQLQLLDMWRTLLAAEQADMPRQAVAPAALSATGPEDKVTYTVAETARLLGVSQDSIYAAVERGDITFLRLGRRILVPAHSLEAMLSTARP